MSKMLTIIQKMRVTVFERFGVNDCGKNLSVNDLMMGCKFGSLFIQRLLKVVTERRIKNKYAAL